jgi:hypothetical protein
VLSFGFARKRYRACVLVKELLRTTNEVRGGVCFLVDFFFSIDAKTRKKHYFFKRARARVKSEKKKKKNGETT